MTEDTLNKIKERKECKNVRNNTDDKTLAKQVKQMCTRDKRKSPDGKMLKYRKT